MPLGGESHRCNSPRKWVADMGLMVTGTCLGKRERSGKFDDGNTWHVAEVMILDDLDVIAVRAEKLADAEGYPTRGEVVAIEVEMRNNKLHGVRRRPEVEAVLAVED